MRSERKPDEAENKGRKGRPLQMGVRRARLPQHKVLSAEASRV